MATQEKECTYVLKVNNRVYTHSYNYIPDKCMSDSHYAGTPSSPPGWHHRWALNRKKPIAHESYLHVRASRGDHVTYTCRRDSTCPWAWSGVPWGSLARDSLHCSSQRWQSGSVGGAKKEEKDEIEQDISNSSYTHLFTVVSLTAVGGVNPSTVGSDTNSSIHYHTI